MAGSGADAPDASNGIFVRVSPKKTLKAWRPLEDCILVLFEFLSSDVDETHLEWRLFWVAGIALLRAIGHVLDKSDAAVSPKHKAEISKLWAELKAARNQNHIFWEFIRKERNNILKTYEFGAVIEKHKDDFYVVYEGGENAFNLFHDAVYWWRDQLEKLEDRLP